MVELLISALIYAILEVCEGVSISLASSTIFESIKDKIFKKGDETELKETLDEVIQELKDRGVSERSIKEIAEKEDKILRCFFDYYSKLSEDNSEIKKLIELLKGDVSEKTKELLDYISGVGLKRTYRIFTNDWEGIIDELNIRADFLKGYTKRAETKNVMLDHNIRIFGRPGSGKSTEIYKLMERNKPKCVVVITNAFTEVDVNWLLREDLSKGFLLIWDDFHERPALFRDTVYKLIKQFEKFSILCAARSTEMEKINEEIPSKFWITANFTEKIDLHEFTREQSIELIRLCCKEFSVGLARKSLQH